MIAQSVGDRGNHISDVIVIQCALNAFRLRNGQGAIDVDGLVGKQTIGAITEFQRKQLLTTDGRIDPGGRTLPRLTQLIGGPEGVFGPAIAQLIPLIDALRETANASPPRVRTPFLRIAHGYDGLHKFRGLAAGLGNGGVPSSAATQVGFSAGPRVFGFVGADDAAAAAALVMMAFILAAFLILLTQNPAFRKEVQIRAKELDRIMKGLQINASVGLKEAVDLVIAIANDTIEEKNRCRHSPTFLASPACTAATEEFAASVARLSAQVKRLLELVLRLTTQRSTFTNLQALRLQFNTILAAAQQETVNLQVALANMREICRCPDI